MYLPPEHDTIYKISRNAANRLFVEVQSTHCSIMSAEIHENGIRRKSKEGSHRSGSQRRCHFFIAFDAWRFPAHFVLVVSPELPPLTPILR